MYISTDLDYSPQQVLHHFLVDSTTEVRSVSEVNTGREGGPVFVRRQKLPKKNFSVSDDVGEVECYTAEDLRIGAEIFVGSGLGYPCFANI